MPPAPDPAPSTMADFAALGQLLEEHRPRLLGVLERRIDPKLRQRVDPEELLQETFLDARREWPAYQRGSPMTPWAWLYGLAYDRLREAYRKEARGIRDLRRQVPIPEESSVLLGLQLAGADTTPGARMVRDEVIAQVRQALDGLSEEDRDILMMRHFEHLSSADIAELLKARDPERNRELTRGAVDVRVFRAKQKFHDVWRALYGDPESLP